MRKHNHHNKYDKQRKYYDTPKPISNHVQTEKVSNVNDVTNVSNSTTNLSSGNLNQNSNLNANVNLNSSSNSNLNFASQEKFLISVNK